MNLEEKIALLIRSLLLVAGVFFIVVVGLGMVIFVHTKTFDMVKNETEFISESMTEKFNSYQDLFISINLNDDIQNYLSGNNNTDISIRTGKTLEQIGNMNENINFMILFDEEGKRKQIRSGRKGLPTGFQAYEEEIIKDYKNDNYSINDGIYINFSNKYGTGYSLGMYYTIYSTKKIDRSLGVLYVDIEDKYFRHILEDSKDRVFLKKTYVVYKNGNILASSSENETGQSFVKNKYLKNEGGFIYKFNGVFAYKKIDNRNMYYVLEMSWNALLIEAAGIIIVLIFILLLSVFAANYFIGKVIKRVYRPLEELAKAMESVSSGKLLTRLPDYTADRDIQLIINGFNTMMDKINELLNKVKQEDKQMMNIKLNALHSQIQPHFLYNTLDCIHWQALLSGNKEISKTVKALAGYYRICLSGGKDIITLEKEVEYLKNYLYIQKMRYGEILHYKIDIEKGLEKYQIPKLTLQPLIENAIYHGIKMEKNKRGHINILIKKDFKKILIEIEDNGVGMTDEEIININQNIRNFDTDFGYGVRNVNRRIELFYGKEYGLRYRKNISGGITVSIVIPCRISREVL